jgi:hypothetical protein
MRFHDSHCAVGDQVRIPLTTHEQPDQVDVLIWALIKPTPTAKHVVKPNLYRGRLSRPDDVFIYQPMQRGEHHVVVVCALPGSFPVVVPSFPTKIDAFTFHTFCVTAT